MNFDKFFFRAFVALMTLGLILVFMVVMNLLFNVPLDAKPLWIGSLIMFLGINLFYDLRGIPAKIITLIILIASMTYFFTGILQWSFMPGILFSLFAVMAVITLYLTMIN